MDQETQIKLQERKLSEVFVLTSESVSMIRSLAADTRVVINTLGRLADIVSKEVDARKQNTEDTDNMIKDVWRNMETLAYILKEITKKVCMKNG